MGTPFCRRNHFLLLENCDFSDSLTSPRFFLSKNKIRPLRTSICSFALAVVLRVRSLQHVPAQAVAKVATKVQKIILQRTLNNNSLGDTFATP